MYRHVLKFQSSTRTDRVFDTVLGRYLETHETVESLNKFSSALDPFVRLAEYMRDAIDGLPDDMQTTIGGGDAQITVGDLRRLLEVKA